LAKIQVGGGIRSRALLDSLLDAGIQRVILGTAAAQDPDFVEEALREYPQNVAIGIDALDGIVRVSGWTQNSNIRAVALAKRLQELGARLVIYTDISRDGVLDGPNVQAVREMLDNTDLSVIASGGVSAIADVRHLAELDHPRLDGVIIGKAIYEGVIQLEEAFANAR
jgi:phosphoribosylformimino-5-aminoimidazole carboxamide ribotide isomerase